MTNNHNEQGPTTADANQQRVITIREGAVAATIWRRQSSAGMEYLDFSLSRSWKSKNGEKEGYSHNFFEANEKALVQVINKACTFIRDQHTERTGTDLDEETIGDERERA